MVGIPDVEGSEDGIRPKPLHKKKSNDLSGLEILKYNKKITKKMQ